MALDLTGVLGAAIGGLSGGSRAQSSSNASNTTTVAFNPTVGVVVSSPASGVAPVVSGDAKSDSVVSPAQMTGDPTSRMPSYLPYSSPNTVPTKSNAGVVYDQYGRPITTAPVATQGDPTFLLLLLGGFMLLMMSQGRG